MWTGGWPNRKNFEKRKKWATSEYKHPIKNCLSSVKKKSTLGAEAGVASRPEAAQPLDSFLFPKKEAVRWGGGLIAGKEFQSKPKNETVEALRSKLKPRREAPGRHVSISSLAGTPAKGSDVGSGKKGRGHGKGADRVCTKQC